MPPKPDAAASATGPVLNINVGVLGHIDSGKTSLARALTLRAGPALWSEPEPEAGSRSASSSSSSSSSSLVSTASFDRSRESRERGITLDLGFSAVQVPARAVLSTGDGGDANTENRRQWRQAIGADDNAILQFTLVDCPGHASLIRTILGGAQIIDAMLLVIDATKGIQTQTAEGLVIGEITLRTAAHMIVVLNKLDLLPAGQAEREQALKKVRTGVRRALAGTRFANAPFVEVSAAPSGGGKGGAATGEPGDVSSIIHALLDYVQPPSRLISSASSPASASSSVPADPFLFEFDHCFTIKGVGTVLTGTVLSGSVSVGDSVEFPSLGRAAKKVKSMQVFHKPVPRAIAGDRVGLCVTGLDAKSLERGLCSSPNYVCTAFGAIARVDRIRFFRGAIKSHAKFHVTMGHSTVMANVVFFGAGNAFSSTFDSDVEYPFAPELDDGASSAFVLLEFEQPVICPRDSIAIASRLDTDIHTKSCRLAFHGKLQYVFEREGFRESGDLAKTLRVFRPREKEGIVERVTDDAGRTMICKGLFKKGAQQAFVGKRIDLVLPLVRDKTASDTAAAAVADLPELRGPMLPGVIDSPFGGAGKFKVILDNSLAYRSEIGPDKRFSDLSACVKETHPKILLRFKKMLFVQNSHGIHQ